MAETHRILAPVLEVDGTTGLGATGLANLVGYGFADVTVSGRARKVPDHVGSEPARAVGCVSPVNRRLKGHADVWGAPRVTLHRCKGVQLQLRSCTSTVCRQ